MLPSFLITFREVIEATLIVATILGILIKLKQNKSIKTVWTATLFAIILSVSLLFIGSVFGLKMQEVYSGKIEEAIEGILMIVSSIFITWAVFFLHNYFTKYKVLLIKRIKSSLEGNEQKGLFALVFTAVFREGFEIVLFLSTIFFSSNPQSIFIGFSGGIVMGIFVSYALFKATLKLPVFLAFRATSILLILFAASLLARGIKELSEVVGITQQVGIVQILTYSTYIIFMTYWVFIKKSQALNYK